MKCNPTILLFLLASFFACQHFDPAPRVLVFSKTNGFRHASIEAGVDAIRRLGMANGFEVTATEDSTFFTEENLSGFSAIIFLNTSGDVLGYREQADFQRFIEAGGGFVGVHGAAATEFDWRWYGKLVGAQLDGYPEVQQAQVSVLAKDNPATRHLPDPWHLTDEWYNFKPIAPFDKVLTNAIPGNGKISAGDFSKNRFSETWENWENVMPHARWRYDGNQPFLPTGAQVLLAVEESSFTGGKHDAYHPIAWQQEYEGGRSFYTSLGHAVASFRDSLFLHHLLGGIRFAIGENWLDYSKTKTERLPPADRFVRTVLAENLDEPMELEAFPDGRIMVVERKGAIKIYDPSTGGMETVCRFPVYHEFEEGLLGVALDPGYERNKWIYLYYSLNEDGRRNRLSRFVFDGNMLHVSSEKMLLEVPELNGCCHAGGSVEFDGMGNLYLSTGDNTNPFESDGYAPIDERPGRALWDAQKSSANTNDLRGKILRIKPEPDGTYSIPDGNLFPPGTPGTRPEIFVMGCRNPFRMSIDSQTGCLYWGDVGPDAGKDGLVRGSKGYDTVNRACSAGNYGWPYARGNHVYFDYDFSKKRTGKLFNPQRPLNDSPFNTGIRELPPVQPPLIWYSYDESLEFPWTATGGKNPMAGPVFHAADFDKRTAGNIFPAFFEGKLFIYEWMRHWIFVVTMDEAGNFVRADPFLPNEKFSRPMDMIFGKDGALYVLEYGEQWFSRNPDARLNKIEYAPGNRKPVASIAATPVAGSAPLSVKFSASNSHDADGDPLRYEWVLKNGEVRRQEPGFDFTFKHPGAYPVSLKVTDSSGAFSTANTEILVGNTPPTLAWHIEGNRTFYWDNARIPYRIDVEDAEDGSLAKGSLDPRRVKVSIDYLPEGKDVAAIVLGHQTQGNFSGDLRFARGKVLIDQSDCRTCHAENRQINGPSYFAIADRYAAKPGAIETLSAKIIAGGSGNWGETGMSAHPQTSPEQAQEMVRYILSLSAESASGAGLPTSGVFTATAYLGKDEKGAYVFQASYRDAGSTETGFFSTKEMLVLRHPKIEAEAFDRAAKGVRKLKSDRSDTVLVTDLFHGRFIAFDGLDLTGIGSVRFAFQAAEPGTVVELRQSSAQGLLLGKTELKERVGEEVVSIKPTPGKGSMYLVFKHEKLEEIGLLRLDWVLFQR
jgi:cytochrome c